jgi:hypothetical protein
MARKKILESFNHEYYPHTRPMDILSRIGKSLNNNTCST